MVKHFRRLTICFVEGPARDGRGDLIQERSFDFTSLSKT